jgi:acyl-CoA thioester hydrolase
VSNRGLEERVTIVIRWRDLDALGHVNSAVFATYFEEAPEDWLRRGLNRMVGREEIVVARIEIDYLRPVTLEDEELLGSTRLLATGEKRLITEERLSTRDGTEVARARATLVPWDPRRSASRKLTDEEKDRLTQVLGAQGKAEAGADRLARLIPAGTRA